MKLTLRFLTYSIPFDFDFEQPIEVATKFLEATFRIPKQLFVLKFMDEILNPEKSFEYFVVHDEAIIFVTLNKTMLNESAALTEVNVLF